MREPTSGRASATGTGVTNPIHRLDSQTDKNGTFMMILGRNLETPANLFIKSE